MNATNLIDWAQDRSTRIPLRMAVSPIVVGFCIFGMVAAIGWLFRKHL